jgi:hypothetical protein
MKKVKGIIKFVYQAKICHIIAARERQFALTTAKAMSHLQLSQAPASFHWLLQGGLLNVICSTVMAQASSPTG